MDFSLNSIQDYIYTITNKDKKQYVKDILDYINQGKRLIAYHGNCTDGSIVAALMMYLDPSCTFIPLDYNILKDKILRPFLIEQDWYAILDLEPFNKKPLDLFIDHHRSVIGSPINAKRIHFEVGTLGPSAAFVLYNVYANILNIPDYLKELVDVSKVTDTASFAIDPPTEIIDKDDLLFLNDFDQLCWFVQDATNIEDEYSLIKNNQIVTDLKESGVKSLLTSSRIAGVNKQREKRINTNEFVKNSKKTPLMVITDVPDNTYRQYVSLKLGKLGVKVIVFLNQKQAENFITISLRQSKLNSSAEIENYRVDLLAKEFNKSGGGHAEAAGSISTSIEDALNVVNKWAKIKNLTYSVSEFTKK